MRANQIKPFIKKNKKPATPKRLIHLAAEVFLPSSFIGNFRIAHFSPIFQTSMKRYASEKKIFLFRFTAYLFCFILFTSAISAQTAPPKEENKREADLIELIKLDKTIKLDIRYARSDNFVGKPVYTEARAFMQRPAADALVRVHRKLKPQGLGLVIFNGYRPWSVTKLFWETVAENQRKYVADPKTGSKHNRGCAVDLSIFDLKTGKLLEMTTDFDDFTEKASPNYSGGTERQRKNRDLLRKVMEEEGFTVNANEWWHFDYKDWQDYAIYDIAFSEVRDDL